MRAATSAWPTWSGAGLIVIGLGHAVLWAVAGGSTSGAVSWRKPTTFGISFGLTTLTLGWVASWLPVRPRVGWLAAGLLGAAVTYGVAWASVQHARGVPAHFNDTTVLDERLVIAGAVMVAIAIGVIAAMTLAAQPPGCGCCCTAWRWWTPMPTRWSTR